MIDDAIDVAKLLIATTEEILVVIDKAKQALNDGTAQLKNSLIEAEKMRDQLAADRKEADTALDKKFDLSKV